MTFRAPVCVPVWIEFSKVTSLTGTRVCASTHSRVFSESLFVKKSRSLVSPSLSFSLFLALARATSIRRERSVGRSVGRSLARSAAISDANRNCRHRFPRTELADVDVPSAAPRNQTPPEQRVRGTYEDLISPHFLPSRPAFSAQRRVPSRPSHRRRLHRRLGGRARARALTLALAHLPDIYVAPVASVREMRFAQRSSD